MRTLRPFMDADMDAVLAIWLAASSQAHDFIGRAYWEEHLEAMRQQYLPASDVWVVEIEGAVQGFCALHGDTVAAIFVAPGAQGSGIGGELIALAQSQRSQLELKVYRRNTAAIRFYERHGFTPEREQTDDGTGEPELVMAWTRPGAR